MSADELRQQALAKMGVVEIERVLVDLAASEQAVRAQTFDERELINSAAGAVLAGDGFPNDIGERLVQLRREAEANAAALAAAREVRRQIDETLVRMRRARADDGLAVVANEVAAAIRDGRAALADLDPAVDTADVAIELGQADAWRIVAAAARRLTDARTVQDELTVEALRKEGGYVGDLPRVLGVLGRVRHAHRWVDVPTLARADSDHARDHGEGWRADGPATPPWLTGDPVAVLRFCARDDVEPWCPSPRELRSLQQAVAEQRREELRVADEERAAEAQADDDPMRARRLQMSAAHFIGS